MLKAALQRADDDDYATDASDEEVRWGGDEGKDAWSELLACYRKGVEGVVGSVALSSQRTHATQPSMSGGGETVVATEDSEFLEFFPEWRTDAGETAVQLTVGTPKPPPRRKRPVSTRPPAAKRPNLSIDTYPTDRRPPMEEITFFPPAKSTVDPISNWGAEGVESDVGAPPKDVEEKLKKQRQAESRLNAFNQLALDKNPAGNTLNFVTNRQKEDYAMGNRRGGGHEILDPGPAPEKTENVFFKGLMDGDLPMVCQNLEKDAGKAEELSRFKVVHAPLKFKGGQLGGFLATTLRSLTQKHVQWTRCNPKPTPGAWPLTILDVIGRCAVCSEGVSVLLTVHQMQFLTPGISFTIYPPYTPRTLGQRTVILAADIVLPAVVRSTPTVSNPDPARALTALVGAGSSYLPAEEWETVEDDEWELEEGMWGKIDAMLSEEKI